MTAIQPTPRASLTATALCLAGVFLALTAVSLTTVDRIKYIVLADRGAATPARLLSALHVPDFFLFSIAAACGLGVLILEVRSRGLTRLLSGAAPLPLALAIAAMLLWFAHAQLAPGLIVVGDGGTHVARVNHLAMAIRDGSSLYWDNYFFAGGTLLPVTAPAGASVTVGIRPEHLVPAAESEAAAHLHVEMVELLGADTIVYGTLGTDGPALMLRLNGIVQIAAGTALPLGFPPAQLHLFDKTTGKRL